MKKALTLVVGLLALATLVAGCASTPKGQQIENKQQALDQTQLLTAQPLPGFTYSQERQNLIELETAKANGVQTTSFFFNLGVQDPIQVCPSIGTPIPTTSQLSNPQQINYDHGDAVTGQMDPTGVYNGDSSGTYVLCIGANGVPYADYWEGYVQTVFAPAKWDSTTHTIELIGPPSFDFSKGHGK